MVKIDGSMRRKLLETTHLCRLTIVVVCLSIALDAVLKDGKGETELRIAVA